LRLGNRGSYAYTEHEHAERQPNMGLESLDDEILRELDDVNWASDVIRGSYAWDFEQNVRHEEDDECRIVL
jgi:hypothetical protein